MSKSNHRAVVFHHLSYCFFFLCFIFFTIRSEAQVRINGQVYYDEDDRAETAHVKIFRDNQLYEELETNKRGKFRVMLQLGHDFLFEISKDFHFTTRFIVSTKLPEEKMEQDVYASFDVETDLIKNFRGLDGSIMDKPIMILRYIPEQDVFDFDREYLNAVRSRVERLMDQSERLEKKGASAIVKPLPKKAKQTIENKPEIKAEPMIKEEEVMISEKTHDEEEKIEPKAMPVKEEVKETGSADNETYEMKMRRERLRKEKEQRANLALKRGYESSLIRQVAEENRQMSRAEMDQRSREKEDSSMIARARTEDQIKKAKTEQNRAKADLEEETKSNQQTKARMETGMIREVASSNRQMQSQTKEKVQPREVDGKKAKRYFIEPNVREYTSTDDFKTVEDLYLHYPSYSRQLSKETYRFGMVNYYIDKQAVEKDTFCKELKALKKYKIKLSCD